MKRTIVEWGLLLSIGMALTLSILWGISEFFDRPVYHLRVSTSQGVENDLHLLVGKGDFSLCDQFESDASGDVRPLIVDPRRMVAADILRGDRSGRFTIPGLDLRYYRMAPSGYLIWSLRLSILFPVVLFLLGAALFWYRLKRLGARIGPRAG